MFTPLVTGGYYAIRFSAISPYNRKKHHHARHYTLYAAFAISLLLCFLTLRHYRHLRAYSITLSYYGFSRFIVGIAIYISFTLVLPSKRHLYAYHYGYFIIFLFIIFTVYQPPITLYLHIICFVIIGEHFIINILLTLPLYAIMAYYHGITTLFTPIFQTWSYYYILLLPFNIVATYFIGAPYAATPLFTPRRWQYHTPCCFICYGGILANYWLPFSLKATAIYSMTLLMLLY